MYPWRPSSPPTATFRDLTVERLVLREPNDGRARAVLEVLPPRHAADAPRVYRVRLTISKWRKQCRVRM